MADYIVTSGELTTVADAIREKNGTSESLSWPDGFVSGIGSGGSSWQTLFEGSVTTEAGQDGVSVSTLKVNITANTIKATFNGTEYTCNLQTYGIFGASFNDDLGEFDFTEYPFAIAYDNEVHIWNLITPSSGTYTLKIEEPQSGGSSDFSTAEVTINKGEMGATVNCIIPWFSEEDNETNAFLTLDELTESWTVKVPVGGNFITVYFSRAPQSISGDIETGSDTTILSQIFKSYVITGDCTITIS